MRQIVEQTGDESVVVGHPLVRRDGAHQIIVRDARGRELLLPPNGRELELWRCGPAPRLTPELAADLAEQLQQWAACQLTVLRRRPL